MVDLGTGERIHIGDFGNNHIYVDFVRFSDGIWGNGYQPPGSIYVTLHYAMIIGSCGNSEHYNFRISGEYYPTDNFPEKADRSDLPHTKEEELQELAVHVKEHALDEAEEIINGKRKVPGYSLQELFLLGKI